MVQPPLLELSFYCHDRSEPDAFATLTSALLQLGVQLAGSVDIVVGPGIRDDRRWLVHREGASQSVDVASSAIPQLLTDPDTFVTRVLWRNATGLNLDVQEPMSYSNLYRENPRDPFPIAIATEGEVFGSLVSFGPRARCRA